MGLYVDPIASALGDWARNYSVSSIILRSFLAIILAAIIGCERATKRHSAGLRTFTIVSLSASTATLVDLFLTRGEGPFLLSAAVIIGISTITVNSIVFSSRNQIKGLTTSVALWGTAILGLACGAGSYTMVLIIFFTLIFLLSGFPALESSLKNRSNHFEVHLELVDSKFLQNFVTTIRKLGLTIDDIELNPAYAFSGLSVYSISISINNQELKKYKSHKEIIEALSTLDYIYYIEEMRS